MVFSSEFPLARTADSTAKSLLHSIAHVWWLHHDEIARFLRLALIIQSARVPPYMGDTHESTKLCWKLSTPECLIERADEKLRRK